ncbi:MAG TPA: hypothetical protein VIU64_17015, partial [Polyangia bacterium]
YTPDGTSVYRARKLADVVVPDNVPAPYDLSRFDLETGAEILVAPGVLGASYLPARIPAQEGDPRSLAMLQFKTDSDIPAVLASNQLPPLVLTFLDEMTGQSSSIDSVDGTTIQLGQTRDDPILVGLFVSDRMSLPYVGVPGALVPLPSKLNQLVGRDPSGIIALTPGKDGGTQRLSRFGFDGSPPVTIVDGALGDHLVVAGDDLQAGTPPPILPSAGVAPRLACGTPAPTAEPASPSGMALRARGAESTTSGGAAPPPAAPPPGAAPPCLLFYDRVWPDATSRGFVQVLDGTPELQLPGSLVGHLADLVQVSPEGTGAFWPAISSTKQTRVFAWRPGTDQAGSCVVTAPPAATSFKVNAWRPGRPQFAAAAQPSSQPKGTPAGWTVIAGTAGSECHVIATGDNLVKQIVYSPGGTYLAFIVSDPSNASQLYVTRADDPAPRLIARGKAFMGISFHDEKHLLLWRWGIDGYSVSWIDPGASTVIDHPVADGAVWDARSSWAWLNDHTVLLADGVGANDDTGSLHIVDIDSGHAELVSQGIVDFAVPWTKRPAGAKELLVTFVTRSRAGSLQDGLWTARIPLDDYPP